VTPDVISIIGSVFVTNPAGYSEVQGNVAHCPLQVNPL
jgi:hypothetical protein